VHIAYHTWYPVPDDPFYLYSPFEIRDRIGYYDNQQVPQLFLDGLVDCGNAPELWQPFLESRIQVVSPMEMAITGHYDPDSLHGEFTVQIYAEADPGALNLWLRAALTESSIYYQAPNGATIHNYIFRDMIPSTDGLNIEIEQGETKYYNFAFDVPQPLYADNCALVAFVQSDQNRQILQGTRIAIPELNNTTDLDHKVDIPSQFRLEPAYPNPFNSSTTMGFAVESGYAEIAIYDITGSLVKTLFAGSLDGGSYEVVWDGKSENNSKVASGIYFCRLASGTGSRLEKITLLK
jgi:hypothetical protein